MRMIIGGEWVDRSESIDVRNPFDDSLVDTVPKGSVQDVSQALERAQEGAAINRDLPVHKRYTILMETVRLMQERFNDLAVTIASEGSKTIREARKEVERAINTMTLSAEESKRLHGETIPFDSMPGSENRTGYFVRIPIGIIAAITPFNDPLNLAAHKLGPAIAGGNAVVLKPATVTPLSALKLGECLLDAGLPGPILSILTGSGTELGPALVTDDRVRMVSFTGGVDVGKAITRIAGLKKMSMELGSNSPVIVLEDCDLNRAVESCVSGAFWAVGQNCIGVQRIYIQRSIYDEFRSRFVDHTGQLVVGPQLDEHTDMGPMITEGEAQRVMEWIEDALDAGATCLTGGTRHGTCVAPTVLENVPAGVKLDRQEVFGPVVSLYPIDDLDEGLQKANGVDYGLHAAIFTRDLNKAHYAIQKLEAGGIMINDSTDYRLDMMPFGGVKNSGLGREGIRFALHEMTEPKVVCFRLNS